MDDCLDDLFGDAPPLHIAEPLPQGLIQHIDEQFLGGCCQKLTWSKNGCIAYVSQDSRTVILRHLLCDPYDGKWRMSRAYPIQDISNAHSEHLIQHLCWGHTGNELAIIDVFGQISIYNVFLALNRPGVMRRCVIDPEDNLGAVVGLMWVYGDRSNFFHQPMQKTAAEGWVFKCSQRRLLGPHNVSQRPALIVVTRSGMIRVLFQGQDNRWQDFKIEVENLSNAPELFSHAAMCPEKIVDPKIADQESAILLATYNGDKELRVHRLRIDFERARIEMQHLKVLGNFVPLEVKEHETVFDYGILLSKAQLTLLEFVPPGPRSGTRESTSPAILASFTYISDGFENPSSHVSQLTVLCKMDLELSSPRLHSTFHSLSSKKTGVSANTGLSAEYLLTRSYDIIVPRILLGIHQINFSTILAMMYSDGSVEYRDRMSMETFSQDARNEFSTLGQTGFDTVMKKHCLHTTISPNVCAVVSIDEQHMVNMNLMHMGDDALLNESSLEVANEAFVMQGSLAAMNFPFYSDDLLATMQTFFEQDLLSNSFLGQLPVAANNELFKSKFLSEMYRVLGLQYDYSIDANPQQIMQNHIIQRCLSTQASLGYAGAKTHASLPALVAQTMLDLRYVAYPLMHLIRSKPGADSELKNPDSVHLTIRLVSWFITLFCFIVDEVFTIADFLDEHVGGSSNVLNLLNHKVRQMNSPALPLLLISSSRKLLRLNCHNMRNLISATKAQVGPSPLGIAYLELEAVFQKAPVTVPQFEHLLSHMDTGVRNTYQKAGMDSNDSGQQKAGKEKRNNIEKDMLIKATIPEIHLDTVRELLTTTVNALKDEINVAELYFLDFRSLGLTDDESSKSWRDTHPMDAMRKTELKKDAKTKRCTRCGALTEDIVPSRGVNIIVMNLQRYCICGSWFMTVDEQDSIQVGNSVF